MHAQTTQTFRHLFRDEGPLQRNKKEGKTDGVLELDRNVNAHHGADVAPSRVDRLWVGKARCQPQVTSVVCKEQTCHCVVFLSTHCTSCSFISQRIFGFVGAEVSLN